MRGVGKKTPSNGANRQTEPRTDMADSVKIQLLLHNSAIASSERCYNPLGKDTCWRMTAVHCTLNTAHCILQIVHCTLNTEHWTLHIVYWKLYTGHFTPNTTHCTLHTKQWTLHNLHCTLCNSHCTLQTAHSNKLETNLIPHSCTLWTTINCFLPLKHTNHGTALSHTALHFYTLHHTAPHF